MRSFYLTSLNFATPRNLSYTIDEKNRKSLPTMVNLKLNFVTEYSLYFWSPYYAIFGFLRKNHGFFHQFRSLLGGFENQFQIRFDDDIFFTKIKVAEKIIFRKIKKKTSNSAIHIAVYFQIIKFSKILKRQFLFIISFKSDIFF